MVNEKNRGWEFKSSYNHLESLANSGICYDDASFVQNEWIRFTSPLDEDTQKVGGMQQNVRLAESCPSRVTDLGLLSNTTFCQALYRGWIDGKHPTPLEGSFLVE